MLHTLEKLHSAPVLAMCLNVAMDTVISVDRNGILEYWQNSKYDYKFPQRLVNFDSKLDTSTVQFENFPISYLIVIVFSQVFSSLPSKRPKSRAWQPRQMESDLLPFPQIARCESFSSIRAR